MSRKRYPYSFCNKGVRLGACGGLLFYGHNLPKWSPFYDHTHSPTLIDFRLPLWPIKTHQGLPLPHSFYRMVTPMIHLPIVSKTP
jgi:hypothetical protein